MRRIGLLTMLLFVVCAASASADGRVTSYRPCASPWVSRAGVAGSGGAAEISMRPTARARAIGDLHRPAVWRDLNRCLGRAFPRLTRLQHVSVYEQFRCHTRYARVPALGGPTWDFEAGRRVIGMKAALGDVARHRCNW